MSHLALCCQNHWFLGHSLLHGNDKITIKIFYREFRHFDRFSLHSKILLLNCRYFVLHQEGEELSVKKKFLKMSEFLVYCKILKDFTMLTISRPRKKLVLDIRDSEQHQIFLRGTYLLKFLYFHFLHLNTTL